MKASVSALRHGVRASNRSLSGVALRMKAAIATKYGEQLEIMDVPVPVPTSGQILVRIRRSGCCHTDIHAIDGDWPVKSKLPLCPGHEGAGEVVSVGPDVTFPKIGDRVGVAWLHSACGRCEYCVSGWETLCTRQHNTGYSVDGKTHSIFIAEHATYLYRIISYSVCCNRKSIIRRIIKH